MIPERHHGTVHGYNLHRRAGEDACERCLKAAAHYQDRRTDAARKGRPYTYPPHGVKRRIEALMAIGWPAQAQAEWLGWPNREYVNRLRRTKWVRRQSHEAICRMYEALSGTPGPSRITRQRAQALGYAPPLMWDDIDDPDEHRVAVRLCSRPDCAGRHQARGLCSVHYRAKYGSRPNGEAAQEARDREDAA